MASPSTVYTVGDFIRRVVDSLLHGECRGQFLCARCLVKLTKDNLDRSYAKPDSHAGDGRHLRQPGLAHARAREHCAPVRAEEGRVSRRVGAALTWDRLHVRVLPGRRRL